MSKRFALLLAVGLSMAACTQAGGADTAAAVAATSATHPESGLPVIPLMVTSANGSAHTFRVEVARSAIEQGHGLMFRTRMGADEGMIFPMDPPRDASFWMRNTVIPLDIVFVGPDGRILNIAPNAVPYSETSLPSLGPVKGVLELNGGRAAQLGIVAGDKVRW